MAVLIRIFIIIEVYVLMENWILRGTSSIREIVQVSVLLAYIDPSSGGMLFQLLAVLFALFSGFILFFARHIKSVSARVRRFFNELFNKKDQ